WVADYAGCRVAAPEAVPAAAVCGQAGERLRHGHDRAGPAGRAAVAGSAPPKRRSSLGDGWPHVGDPGPQPGWAKPPAGTTGGAAHVWSAGRCGPAPCARRRPRAAELAHPGEPATAARTA